ncbi:MAG: SpoIIE family protein phosphatase, partial [Candidatus Aminicenantes bacterium]|nr:SpoIIE family protein phosphatase [Candidatus Aminicenantes bacterium]
KLFVYPKKGKPFWLTLKKEKVSIGRSADNTISVADSFCSGHHAFLYPSESGYAVRDNSSKNGTFVNGKKIQSETELKKGDEILIGLTRIIFDKELSTNVEVIEAAALSANVNTVIHLKDILKKPDIDTTFKADYAVFDAERIKSEHKAYSVLSEVSKALISHKPIEELLDHVMDLICQNLPMDRGILMLREGNPAQLIPKVVRINNKDLKNRKIQVSQSIINIALNKNSAVLTYDAQSDPRFRMQDSIIKSSIHSAMCVPLWNNKEIIGIVYSDRIYLLDQFSEEDLRLLILLSNLAAVKIENAKLFEESVEKERIEKELELAAQIQKDLLPKENPECENFEIAGSNIPCHQVGGDYYDFITIDPCRLGIIIADVSGKGVSASLLMASLRGAVHSEVYPHYKLEEMAAKLNNYVHRSSAINRFITFFFCELNRKSGELRYINAGHNPPLILDRKGKIHRLESCGLCLGVLPSVNYEAKKVALNPGDVALLFTDGITESLNKENEEYSEDKLIRLLKKHSNLPAQKLLERIFDEVNSFTSGAEQIDDMTLVVIKRTS